MKELLTEEVQRVLLIEAFKKGLKENVAIMLLPVMHDRTWCLVDGSREKH